MLGKQIKHQELVKGLTWQANELFLIRSSLHRYIAVIVIFLADASGCLVYIQGGLGGAAQAARHTQAGMQIQTQAWKVGNTHTHTHTHTHAHTQTYTHGPHFNHGPLLLAIFLADLRYGVPVGLHSQIEDGVKGFLICSFCLCSSACTQHRQVGRSSGAREG